MDVLPSDHGNARQPIESAIVAGQPPRLRLHHLFVLTAVMALLLAINGPQRSYNYAGTKYQVQPVIRTLLLVIGIMHTILSATALTALGYGIAWYRRGLRFFDQPGHWLLVELSCTALIGIVPSIGYRWLATTHPERISFGDTRMVISMIIAGYSLIFLVLGRMALDIYLGNTKCNERRWKFVFYAKAVGTVLFGLGSLIIVPSVIHALHRPSGTGASRCGSSVRGHVAISVELPDAHQRSDGRLQHAYILPVAIDFCGYRQSLGSIEQSNLCGLIANASVAVTKFFCAW